MPAKIGGNGRCENYGLEAPRRALTRYASLASGPRGYGLLVLSLFSLLMTRLDEESLVLRREVALSVAAPELVEGLAAADRYRRTIVAADVARHLAGRLAVSMFGVTKLAYPCASVILRSS